MDAKTIAGAGLMIGGGLVGYKAMKDLSGLGCYGPGAYLTLGLTGIGAGLWMFGKLRQDAMKKKGADIKDKITDVMGSEYYPQLPEGMEAGAIVVPNTYGDTSSAAGMPQGSGRGVPQWYGSAEGRRYGKRDRYTDRWGNARYFTRRKDGSIVTSVNIAGKRGAVANDRRQNAINYAKSGYRQMGDANPQGMVERGLAKLGLGSEHHKGQGYDDEMDESLGMRHRGKHKQSFKDRRDEASAMDKKHGGRKYHDVQAMDSEDMAGLPVIPDSYGTNSALESGQGVPVWYGSAETNRGSKYGRRQRFVTSKGNSRYVARDTKGRFISNVAVAGKRGSIAADMRQDAKSYAPENFRQMGDKHRRTRREREMGGQ